MIGLTTTKPNCHLAVNQGELSAGANSFTLVRPRAPHYDWMTPVTPNVKLSHNNSPRFSPRYFPEVHKSCISLFFAEKKNCKFMRMMLMSVSSILMTLQTNWALIEVPLSICRVFFLSGQVLRRPLPKRSQQPVKASPLHSHTKRAFSPWILNRRACRIFFVLLEENLFRGLRSPVGQFVLLWKEWEAYYVFRRMTAPFKSTPTKNSRARFYPCNCCHRSLFLLA